MWWASSKKTYEKRLANLAIKSGAALPIVRDVPGIGARAVHHAEVQLALLEVETKDRHQPAGLRLGSADPDGRALNQKARAGEARPGRTLQVVVSAPTPVGVSELHAITSEPLRR